MAKKDSRRLQAEAAAGSADNLAFILYEDGNYKYFCEALAGTDVTESEWRISRMDVATSQIEWCGGNTSFDNPADNIGVVEVLPFS